MFFKQKKDLLALSIAGVYFGWKVLLYSLGKQHEILANFPILPLIIALGAGIIFTVIPIQTTAETGQQGFDLIRGFKAGARLSLITALFTAVFSFVYYKFIDPTFFEMQIALSQQQIINMGGAPKTDQELEPLRKLFNPVNWAALTISGVSFLGMVLSLTISALYKVFISK